MTIPQRILLHVAVGAGLAIAVATALTYEIVYRAATARELKHLETYVTERAQREELGFRQVEANLTLVRGQFLKRMEAPVPADYEAKWNARFEQSPDGAWRSQKKFADGRKHSTLWAHKGVVFTPELKTQVLRAQDICDELLPGWADAFPSVYFVLPGWLNIGFDPRLASWVWDTPADYDPSALEWFQLSMPTNRPAGGIAWSGVIEEPTSKVPIVSVYLPIEKDGQFLGSVGHDLFVNRLMEETTRSGLPGAMHVIFRRDGRLIAHPTKRAEILASVGRLRMQDSEPKLAGLYDAITARGDRQFSGYDEPSKSYYSVARLAGPEWVFLTTMPREQLQALAYQSAQWVLWSGLASLGLLLGFLAVTLRKQIALPLVELTRATKQMSAGDVSARAHVGRGDELGELAGAFNEMTARVASRDAELQAEKASLERRVAERTAALSESEARFVTAFRHSPAMQSLVRVSDRVLVEVNDTFLNNLGFVREQVLGRTVFELNFWIDPAQQANYRQELESKGYVLGYEVRLRARDGRVLTVLLSSQPVDIAGVPHLLSAGVDITARKEAEAKLLERERQLRESEARLSTVFRASPTAVSLGRLRDGKFVAVNEAFVHVTGYTEAEIIGRNSLELGLYARPEARETFFQNIKATGFVRDYEYVLRTKQGQLRTVALSAEMVEVDGEPHVLAVILDLTERKRAEAELLKTLERERELGELKSNFVSLVSHEFRTPLEIIMSSVDNLDRYHDRLPPEKRQQLLQTVNKAVRRMAGMMEEVLVLGRLETDRMTFKPADLELPSFCRRVCDEIESATGGRCPIQLLLDDALPLATGDESLLRHIFTNLLSNAVKYSPAGRPVDFAIVRAVDRAVCRVSDQGCGIPEADQKRMFEAFHRGSNVQQIPGTGLGLLIVRRCVELHGGTLNFDSREGQGTTFVVSLPLFAKDPAANPTP